MAEPTVQHDYLDPQTLAAVGSLELRSRMIVEGFMTGMHRSPYQGVSIEFAQHRAYAPGDDLRHLDWKVYGRTDKLYIKQYQQETNLDLWLLVDGSGSMAYTSNTTRDWTKFDAAAAVTGALAYLALQQQDRIGLMVFDDKIEQAVRPSNTRGHWRSLVAGLTEWRRKLAADAKKGELEDHGIAANLERVVGRVASELRQRSLIVIVGDFFDDTAPLQQALARLRFRQHDVVLLQTLDPAELTFPFRGPSEFLGLEGEGRLRLDPAALKRAYLDALDEHLKNLQQFARTSGYDHLMLDTSASIGPPLSQLLAYRASLVRKGA